MGVGIEWITGVIRAGEEFNKMGDPYEFSCVISKDRDSAVLKGASGKMPKNFRRDLRELLRGEGIKRVYWETKTNGYRKTKAEV